MIQVIGYNQESALCALGDTTHETGRAENPPPSRAWGHVCGQFYIVNRVKEGPILFRAAHRLLPPARIGIGMYCWIARSDGQLRPDGIATPLSPRPITH